MKAFFVILGLAALYLLGHLLLRDTKNLKIPKIPKKPEPFDDEEDDWPDRPKR